MIGSEAPAGHDPAWCVMRHGNYADEEDQVHISDPTFVRNTMLRLCMTVDPVTGVRDGPYVLIGSNEYDLADTALLIQTLTNLLEVARAATGHATA